MAVWAEGEETDGDHQSAKDEYVIHTTKSNDKAKYSSVIRRETTALSKNI